MRKTIAQKLSRGFIVTIALLALGSAVTFWQMGLVIHAQKVSECRAQEVKASYEILSAVGQINGALRGYILATLTNDPDESTKLHKMIDESWTRIDTAVGSLQALDPKLRSAEIQQHLPGLLTDLQETRNAQYAYLRLEESGDEGAHQASVSINANSMLWAEKVRAGARSLVDLVSEQSRAESRHAVVVSTFALVIAIVIGLLVAGLAMLAALQIRRRLAAVPALISHARQIASGDLDVDHLLADSHDEIGDLDRSFAEIVAYLREMASHSQAIASGDLSIEVFPRSNRDALSQAFVQMRGGLETLVRESRERATQVADASAMLAEASDRLAKVGEQGASRTNQVTTTMHEMNVILQGMVESAHVQAQRVAESSSSAEELAASIDRIASGAERLLQLSDRSRQETENGLAAMQRTEEGLYRIQSVNRVAHDNARLLKEKTTSISRISAFIEDVADQTNLLALNATIEAARAGEHGAGFGVLADELTKLASRSGESAHEIAELVETVHQEVVRSEEQISQSASVVEQSLKLAAELRESFSNISDAVRDVDQHAREIGAATQQQASGSTLIAQAAAHLNKLTQEMASSVEQQAAATRDVADNMDSMSHDSREISSSSAQLAASAEQMSRMSRDLLEIMERFQIPEAVPMIETPHRLDRIRRANAQHRTERREHAPRLISTAIGSGVPKLS